MKPHFTKLDLQSGFGEMVLSVKYLSYWHEDLSSYPQTHIKVEYSGGAHLFL